MEYHALAHTVVVDVLAFGGTGTARDHIQIWTSSISGPVCGLGRSRGLPHSGVRLHRQDEVESSYSLFDGLMDGAAVMHDIVMSAYELLEWRIDVVEINIGDEAIDAGVDAGGSDRKSVV